VITVPAYFNDSQRQATKDAGTIAGLKVERIINEPTAAALAYGSTRRPTRRSPSTTWAAARSTSRSSRWATAWSRSSATNGDTHLGGDDFDEEMINHVAEEFRKEQGSTCARTRWRSSASRRPARRPSAS
jgi:molecular chaperone DnaK